MKKAILGLCALLMSTTVALAHDGGHGPKLNDVGKHGGVVSAVVADAEKALGAKAKLVYKAELVRMQNGDVQYYLYDPDMKPIALDKFDKKASGTVAFVKKKKKSSLPFTLEQKDGAYVGKTPLAGAKPFDIDIVVKEGNKTYLSAFDNLD